MKSAESEIETAINRVREVDGFVSRQLEIIAKLRLENRPTEAAESLLLGFQENLRIHQNHLDHVTANQCNN